MKLIDVVSSLVCDQNITNTDMVNAIIYLVDSLGSTQAIKKVKEHVDEIANYELNQLR